MSDQNFHEIQLTKKQLVFFFMCCLVLGVTVFLFGVSVGRQVRSSTAQAAPAIPADSTPATADTTVPAEPPPAAQAAANELSYAQALAGTKEADDLSKAAPPTPASEEPAAPPAKSEPKAAAPAKATPTPAPPATPQKSAPPPKATTTAKDAVPDPPAKTAAKASPPLSGWQVQTGAFNTNDIASGEVTKLRTKGFPAFVFTEPETTPGPRFKVLVGPYSARAEADQMLKSLAKEGYKPFLKR